MEAKLTNSLILKSSAKEKRYSISDTETRGLIVRVEPSGTKHYYCDYRNPRTGKRVQRRLGYTNELTVTQARELVQKIRASVRNEGVDPTQIEKTLRERPTLGQIVDLYRPWIHQHRKSVRQTEGMLNSFSDLFPIIVEELAPSDISKWKQKNAHLNPKTINRKVALLKGMLSWAVKEGHINTNLLRGRVEMLKEEDSGRIRYLTPDERKRLLHALTERDDAEQDYFKCAVLLSLNTGIRKGTLLALKWEYIDFVKKLLRLPAKIMKSGKTKIIPLNQIAVAVLREWRERSKPTKDDGYVFPGEKPETHLGDTKKPWMNLMKKAGIQELNWHDMRHDFASQLAMQGVDILTIQKLMTHENLKMTLVYAHLSPQHLENAVDELSNLYI